MKTTKELIDDVASLIGTEETTIKDSCFAIYWAVDAIQVDEADNEGEPCSRTKAIKILRTDVLHSTGIDIKRTQMTNRYLVGQWLRQQNRVFIPGLSFTHHMQAQVKGATWKELKMNPEKFKLRRPGINSGGDIRDGDVIDIPPHVKAAITVIERTLTRCGYEAVMHDEEGEFSQSAHFHNVTKEFGLALPHLRVGMTELMAGIN